MERRLIRSVRRLKPTVGSAAVAALIGFAPAARAGEPVASTPAPAPLVGRILGTASLTPRPAPKFTPVVAARPQDPAPAEAPAGPAPGTVTITGLIDLYYGINARAPRGVAPIVTPSGESIGVDNVGVFFNVKDREPVFNLGEVNINRTEGKGFPLGVTATLTFGDAARLFHATEPGGTSSWQTLHNLFLSKNLTVGGKTIAVDFGKFASPFGTEVLETPANDNATRAFSFWYGVPFYHFGLRATAPITNKITAQAGLVNGWNDVADSNNAKSTYLQFTFKPNPRFTQILGWIGGAEGTGGYGTIAPTNGGGSITTHLLDFQSIYQATDKFKVGGWAIYGSGSGTISGAPFSGNWLGLVAYLKYQATPAIAAAFRAEQFEDIGRTGGVTPRFQVAPAAGAVNSQGLPYLKARGFTFTLEYQTLKGISVSRLEYRHDLASAAIFGAGAGTSGDQDTFWFSQSFRF